MSLYCLASVPFHWLLKRAVASIVSLQTDDAEAADDAALAVCQ